MNLADILIPNNPYCSPAGAERAERAESQQQQGLQSPPQKAERGGEYVGLEVIRPIPPVGAGSEGRAVAEFPPNPPNPPALMAEIEKPLPVTADYFRTQGVDVLADDLAFLRWNLPTDTAGRNESIRRYIAAWLDAVANEPTSYKKVNQGRFAANSLLRGVS